MIGDKIAAANIPLIAIDIPHPNATYFGVDNYRVGHEAGEVLAEHALTSWKGKVDWVIGLDLPKRAHLFRAGSREPLRQCAAPCRERRSKVSCA